MAPIERDATIDCPLGLRHKHSSSSDHGKALTIPMWDSSDPERAPPPLPLNPQSPSVGPSRPGTSTAIQSAHAAMTEKAREANLMAANNLIVNPLNIKRLPDMTPERPLPRPSTHRRMQSLQPTSVRERGLMIEGIPSSPISPQKTTRPSTPVRHHRGESMSASPEKELHRGSLGPGPTFTPVVRPIVKRPQSQSILGENTPPQSATMLALHNLSMPAAREAETPPPPQGPALSNITNSPPAAPKAGPSLDTSALSNQIVTLTAIATALQKDMSALSRRSRDNATDLMSLKQATTSRDEDIRKTLRDLMGNLTEKGLGTRDPFYTGLPLDGKDQHPHMSPPQSHSDRNGGRPFSLPRVLSPNSFAASFDRDSVCTPSLSSAADAPATIALLEKIIRDMGTREGQDLLITRLTEVAEKLAGMASATKVEELLRMIKNSHHVSAHSDGSSRGSRSRQASFEDEVPRESRHVTFEDYRSGGEDAVLNHAASDLVNDEVLNIIKSVKDSVAQGGGLTAEVKALVRELRGEVLGMGRELGRRLEDMAADNEHLSEDHETKEMKRVINEGLDELKDQMDGLLHEHRRQSVTSATSRESLVDYQEIYNALRAALKDTQASDTRPDPPTRDDVIDAVREAWENYKPEIEVQQFGLERDEILACLKEGLQGHAPRDDEPIGATREEVFRAVVEGLKHFVPPQMETPATLSRDEILDAVRDCLEEFEFPVAPSALGNDLSRDDMVQAVREGLHDFEFPSSQALTVSQPGSDEVMVKLAEIIEFMRHEFRSVSDEARENVAASGRDTEQVLDATKDGFEKLRQDMEVYVDRISGLSGRGESSEELLRALGGFRDEISDLLLSQVDSLRDTVNMSLVPATPPHNPMKEALEAIGEGLDRIRGELQRPLPGTNEVLDALQEGLTDLHHRIEKLGNRPADLTANDEILEALRTGIDSVRSDLEDIRDARYNEDRALATIGDDVVAQPAAAAEGLKQNDIKNLEDMITQLRVKVEAMEGGVSGQETVSKDDLSRIEQTLGTLKEAIDSIPRRARKPATEDGEVPEGTEDTDLKEDVQAIETILRNTKARLDDLIDGEQVVRKEHVQGLETILLETREALGLITAQMEDTPRQADFTKLESLISNVVATYDEMKEHADKQLADPERVTKTDVEAVEAVCLDVKGLVNEFAKSGMAALPTKEDLNSIAGDLKEHIDDLKDSASKAVAERDAEAIDINARIVEVKDFLAEFQDATKTQLEDGVVGLETVGKLLERMGEIAENNGTVSDDLKEMLETMKAEFEESRAGVDGAKVDSDEKLQLSTDTLASKIDERIDELIAKYDEFQTSLDERAEAGEARNEAAEAAVVGTQAVAEELKLLIDALGSSVTESLEKMEEASKTVYNRIEDLVTRADENHTEDKAEHEQTREKVKEVITAVESLHGPVSEMEPKVLEAVKGVLEVINQHNDQAQSSVVEIQRSIEDAKPEIPEKYDDSGVQEKLDTLVGRSEALDEALAKLEAALKESSEAIVTGTGEKLDTLVTGNETLDAYVRERLEVLFVNSEATGAAVSQFDVFVKDKLETLATSTGERLDGILVNTEATGEAFSQFDTSVKEKIDDLVTTTAEKLESILVNTEATGEGFSQLDTNIRDRLDKILGNTGATGEALSQLDGLLKEKLEKLVDHADATGESVTRLDGDVKERLEKLLEQTLTAGKAFDRLDGSVGSKLDQLIDHTQEAGKTFEKMDSGVGAKLNQLIDQTQEVGKAFEKMDGGVGTKLDQLIDHTQEVDKAFEKMDGGVGTKLDQLIDHAQEVDKAFEKMDGGVGTKLDQLIDHGHEVDKAFDQLGGSVGTKLDQLIDHGHEVDKAFDQLDGSVGTKLDQLIDHAHEVDKAFEKIDGGVGAKLDQLVDHTHEAGKAFEQMDTTVQEKLDKLMDGSRETGRAFEQLEALDKMHGQVMAAAASISEFLSSQRQRISDEDEERERTLRETELAIERANVEREHVEGSVAALREEEARLGTSVTELRAEGESLAKQKTRLAAEVSSLETALRLRREELGEMEERAEGLERRILEGVMNHSRVLIMSRGKSGGGSESMNRKRVRPQKGTEGGPPGAAEQRRSVVGMALSTKRNLATPGGSPAAAGSRRIVSLSQINNNVPAGGFTRSHSVKAPSGVGRGGVRQGSWGGALKGYGDLDKENVADVKEEEEEEAEEEREEEEEIGDNHHPESETDGGVVSEAGTLRRNRRATDASSTYTEEYAEGEDDHSEYYSSGSEGGVSESAVGTTLSGVTVTGNEVVLAQ